MALLPPVTSMSRPQRHAALIAVSLFSVVLLALGAAGAHATGDNADVSACSGSSPYYTAIEHEHTRRFLESFKEAVPALASLWTCDNFCAHSGIQCTEEGLNVTLNSSVLSGSLPELPNDIDGFRVALYGLTFVGDGERLIGSLPVSWNLLTRLSHLDVRATALSGTLPETWGTPADRRVMTRRIVASPSTACNGVCLRVLRLGGNHLTGTLPANWGKMTTLQEIWINDNLFTGTLPPEWSALANLRTLNARSNLLSGTLPAEWASMESIRQISIDNNNFCGCVPDSWKKNTQITIDADEPLWMEDCATSNGCDTDSSSSSAPSSSSSSAPSSSSLDDCYTPVPFYSSAQQNNTREFLEAFKETIPILREIWVCPNFCTWLYVQCTSSGLALEMAGAPLAGSLPRVPTEVDVNEIVVNRVNMSDITNLGNQLPPSWGSLVSMEHIAVPGTFLFGNLPSEWGGMSGLKYLDAGGTMLTGQLPSTWSNLKNLEVLRINEAMLSGSLPDTWSSMTSLKELDLSTNTIDAILPSSWRLFKNIRSLQLQSNHLRGTLPQSWKELTNIEEFRVDDNQLIGRIPESYSAWINIKNADLRLNNFCECLPSRWVANNGITIFAIADAPVVAEDCATENQCTDIPPPSSSSSSSSAPSSSSSAPSSSSSSAPSSSSSAP
ncbi:proteophosphoglycan ppg4, partial [Leishmania panamensis]